MGISMITFLPTMMISKCEINGQQIDYENYLTELVNLSTYFMGLTYGEKYTKIIEHDNGQADVRTSNYELDFKLLVNQDFVNNKLKSLPNVDYSHIKDGYVCMMDKSNAGNSLTPAKANSVFVLFFNRLLSITKEQIEKFEADKNSDLYSIIKMMKKEKNLLFFLPFEIECFTDIEVVNTVARIKNIFTIRDSINKDTFIAVLRKEKGTLDEFYILKYEDSNFRIVDKVPKLFIFSFNELYKLTSFTESR